MLNVYASRIESFDTRNIFSPIFILCGHMISYSYLCCSRIHQLYLTATTRDVGNKTGIDCTWT